MFIINEIEKMFMIKSKIFEYKIWMINKLLLLSIKISRFFEEQKAKSKKLIFDTISYILYKRGKKH